MPHSPLHSTWPTTRHPTADELREGWYSVTNSIVIPQGFRSTQQPQCVDPMPIQYWSDGADAGPTLNRIRSAEHL